MDGAHNPLGRICMSLVLELWQGRREQATQKYSHADVPEQVTVSNLCEKLCITGSDACVGAVRDQCRPRAEP